MPYSQEKEKQRSTMLFWKACLKQIRNKWVNEDAVEKRRCTANITHNYVSYDEIKVRKKLEDAQ